MNDKKLSENSNINFNFKSENTFQEGKLSMNCTFNFDQLLFYLTPKNVGYNLDLKHSFYQELQIKRVYILSRQHVLISYLQINSKFVTLN